MHPGDSALARRSFHFLACIGRGGFGEVYRAEMSLGGISTEVAIKILQDGMDRQGAGDRLWDEGRMLSVLKHKHILRLHDVVWIQGRRGLVVEFVEGLDLDKLTLIQPLPVKAAAEVTLAVLDGLIHAWNVVPAGTDVPLNVVHRDIKPANIRIGRSGEIKLLDFGIAHARMADRAAKTGTDVAMGSHPYMAPEQFSERPDVTSAIDVYGLAATWYEAITGQRLWPETLVNRYSLCVQPERHAQVAAQRVRALNLPEALQILVLEMLAVNPSKRPSTAECRARICRSMSELPGPDLMQFLATITFPEARSHAGTLVGLRAVEGGAAHTIIPFDDNDDDNDDQPASAPAPARADVETVLSRKASPPYAWIAAFLLGLLVLMPAVAMCSWWISAALLNVLRG